MSNRLAAGFTVAGFPLTAALLAISAGNFGLAIPLGALFVIAAVLTFAPKLPVVHVVPVVGAPKITARFKANGSVEFHDREDRPRVRLALPEDAFPGSVLVQIGVTNHSDQDVAHALMNFGAPVRMGLQACDAWGHPRDVGQQMPPTHEGYDYWALDDYRLTGGDGRLIFFRFRASGPGIFPVYISISSRGLYRELTQWSEIEIVARPRSEISLRDLIGPQIDRGELLARQIPDRFTGDPARLEYLAWFLETFNVLSDEERLRDEFQATKADWPGEQIGDEFYLAELRTKVKHLYDLRDFLGRPDWTES
jgi:hypothetical protein